MPHLAFVRAYGIMRDLYVGNDGKVHYGQIENGYRDFLDTFNQWYREGLVDRDLVTLREQEITAKMTGNVAGSSYGALGSRIGAWITTSKTTNPGYNLQPAPMPSLKKGEKPAVEWGMNPAGATGAGITPACKYPDLAARHLDWGYTDEGYLLNNFGIEGVSYRMINGYPTFTDEVLNNPRGWPSSQALSAYATSADSGPMIQDIRYYIQYMVLQEQKDALTLWASDNILRNILPPVTLTTEESQEYSRIMSEINTYQSEMEVKFILGTESLSGWDNYVNTMKRMGIDRAIELQNAALIRYNKR